MPWSRLTGVDSDRITVESCEIYDNFRGGIYTDASNEHQRITGNRMFGGVDGNGTGIRLLSTSGAVVSNNSVFNIFFGTGIEVRSMVNAPAANSVTNNNVYFTSTGIFAVGNTGNGSIAISGNDVHDSRSFGIQTTFNALVTGNTVHHNPSIGISGLDVRNNTVYGNFTGIDVAGGLAQGNRVYNNSVLGIITYGGTVQSNVIVFQQRGRPPGQHRPRRQQLALRQRQRRHLGLEQFQRPDREQHDLPERRGRRDSDRRPTPRSVQSALSPRTIRSSSTTSCTSIRDTR